jgi:hypothetical protein
MSEFKQRKGPRPKKFQTVAYLGSTMPAIKQVLSQMIARDMEKRVEDRSMDGPVLHWTQVNGRMVRV